MGISILRLGSRVAGPAALALLLLTVVPLGAGVASAASTPALSGSTWSANCDLNLRSKPTTLSTKRTSLPAGTIVTVSAKVSGGWYASRCGKTVSGRAWLRITAIGGRSVASLFGVGAVYAASALFKAMPTTPTAPAAVKGIDVSRWQGKIDFTKVQSSGVRFVIVKATEGRLYTDAAYARNKAAALSAKLAFTAYHFAHPDRTLGDARREADHFLAVAGLHHGMLAPVLDLETAGTLRGAALQRWVQTWLARVTVRLGVHPIIYTNPGFWRAYMGDSRWYADHGYTVLWIANWRVSAPGLPASGWGGHSWGIWQYSDCGHVSGISGCVDLDRLSGPDLTPFRF